MVAQPIPVPRFRAESEEPVRVLPLTDIRPAAGRVSVRTGPGADGDPATGPSATAANPPVMCLLVVEEGGEKASLTLPMRTTPLDPPDTYHMEIPGTVRGIRLAMRVSATGPGSLQLETDYTGLESAEALAFARFVAALKREVGTFTVSVYVGGRPRHLVTVQLPLPFEDRDRERSRQELRFWEAVHEVSRETGARLVCPPEITDSDLKSLNVVLGAVRNGWLIENVKSFTIPPTEETAENFLRVVEEQGNVLSSFALLTEHETYEIFGTEIDLGTCIRHVSAARLLTPLDEIRGWLSSDPAERGPLVTTWEPVDGAPMTVLFQGWPKPASEQAREQDIEELLRRKGGAPLRLDTSGTVRVGGTRVTLDSIAAASGDGETAEGIATRYPDLAPADLNQILGWYFRYRDSIDAYLAQREGEAESQREEIENSFDPRGVRERLLARRGGTDDPEGMLN